jgi:hypothetical protein
LDIVPPGRLVAGAIGTAEEMPSDSKEPCVGATMSDTHNQHLFGLLRKNETLRQKGFSLAYSPSTGIVIDRSGHVHGIWNHDAASYTWVSPGNSEPKFRTETASSAVLYTVVVLAQV